MKGLIALGVFVVGLLLALWMSAVVVGLIGAVFLERPWSYGYHRGWERWGWLTVFWLLVFGGGSAGRSS